MRVCPVRGEDRWSVHYHQVMESSLVLNVLVLLVSIATLLTSLLIARRQLRLAHNSNVLPIIIDMFKDTREPEFSRSIEYLLSEFIGQYPHEDGYLNLPPEPRHTYDG